MSDKNKAPAFQLYAARFTAGTIHMTAEEVGGFMRLLCYQWDNGSIPDDDKVIMRIAGFSKKSLANVREKFFKTDSGLINRMLERVRAEQEEYKERNSLRGKAGAAKRWANKDTQSNAQAMPEHNQSNATGHANTMPENGSTSTTTSTINTITNKQRVTKIGNREEPGTTSEYLWRTKQYMVETTMMQFPDLKMKDVLARLDLDFPQGYHFKDENHPFNAFRSLCKLMLDEKARTGRRPGRHAVNGPGDDPVAQRDMRDNAKPIILE